MPEIRNKVGVARHFGVSTKVVEGWISAGMPVVSAPADKHGEYQIALDQAWRWAANEKLARAAASELDIARTRLAKEQADLLEVKLAEMRASLLPAGEVAEAWRLAREQARQILHDMIDALAPRVVAAACVGSVEEAALAVRELSTEAIDGALTRLQHMLVDDA